MRDKLDWHASSAVDNGQPEEHGFVHIACFLHWLGLRDWLAPRVFSKAARARIADGSTPLADLIDLTDEQLTGDMATPEGSDFGEARYDAYVERWDDAFAHLPTYAVGWTGEARARAAAILDELYATWVADGNPRPEGEDRGEWKIHLHPEVEDLIPRSAAGLAFKVDSMPPFILGNPPIDDHLQAAGVELPRAALVFGTHAYGRQGTAPVEVHLLVIPGREAADLGQLLAPTAWNDVAHARVRRLGDLEVVAGYTGDWHAAAWYRDNVAAKVRVRRARLLGPIVEAVDARLHGPVEVIASEEARTWPPPDPWDRMSHTDPDLEALLPARVMGVRCERGSDPLTGFNAGLRRPIEEIGFDPDRSTIAEAIGPEQISLSLVSVPGAPATVLREAFERFERGLIGERPRPCSRASATVRCDGPRARVGPGLCGFAMDWSAGSTVPASVAGSSSRRSSRCPEPVARPGGGLGMLPGT